MRTHTSEFKEKIKLFGREIKGKIIYYPSYGLISESEDNILTENDLQLISEQANYDEPIEIDEENIFSISIIKNGDLLQSLMKEFDFEAKDELNIGSVVNPHLGLLIDEENQEYEYLDYRNYIIYSKEFNMDTETWSYICYDKMLFSMVKYVGIKNTTYPITLKEYINKLCNKVGLEFEDSVFVNQDQLIYEDLYKDKNLTYRDVFDEISKIVAGNLLINDNDKLEVGYINKAVSESGEESGSSIEITDGEEAELINFELEGKTTQESTPTPDNPSELVSVGYENLLNLTDGTYTTNGITGVVSDGTITLNGTATANAFVIIPLTNNINWENGKSYTLSAFNEIINNNVLLRTNPNAIDDMVLSSTNRNRSITYNSSVIRFNNTIQVRVANGTTLSNFIIKPQLAKGTQIHSYIPYGKYGVEVKTTDEDNNSKTYLYTLDNPLRAIGDYKDKLYIENGMLYVDRKIGDIVLNGDENWVLENSGQTNFRYTIYNFYYGLTMTSTNSLCNYFPIKTITNATTDYGIYGSGTANYFRIRTESEMTLANFKTWLSTHNTEVQYVLNESYTEEIGQVNIPSTYEGITYIDTTDELEPTMNVTYISEFEEIDEQYLKDTNVAVGKKFGVINSVAVLDTENNLQYLAEDTSSIKENEMTRITITDNLLALNGDTQTIADNILNKLNGLYYYINDFTTTGVCYYDFLDLFNVKARGNTYQCLLLNNEITISQGIEEHIFTEKLEESETSANEYTTSVMSNKQASFKINQQEAKIESRVEKDGVISAINQSAEEVKIDANKISLEGKVIDLTSDNIIIDSTNFSVDKNGNLVCNSANLKKANLVNATFTADNVEGLGSFIEVSSGETYNGEISTSLLNGLIELNNDVISGNGTLIEPQIRLNWDVTQQYTTLGASGCYSPLFSQTSHVDKKKNFEKLENAIDIVKNSDIYKYNWKTENDNQKKHIGLVIGNGYKTPKEVIDEKGMGIDTYAMTSVLWKAVKEQQEEIEKLKEMINNGKS